MTIASTVATFNVEHGVCRNGRADVALLARACAELHADVLALQEVDRNVARSGRADMAAVIAQATGLHHAFVAAHRVRVFGRFGNALLTRRPPSDVVGVPLPRVGRREPRAALLATVDVGGVDVTTVVAHLSRWREESEPQLRFVLELLRSRPAPRLLLGDLNRRANEVRMISDAGFDVAGGPPTYPAEEPRLRIDHLAVQELTLDDVRAVATPCSDHRALVAQVTALRR